MKKTKALRQQLKKIYQFKKALDREDIGKKKNDMVQAIHLQRKLPQQNRDQELVKECAQTLALIAKEQRFSDQFPSFSKFYTYITDPKNKFTMDDIKSL